MSKFEEFLLVSEEIIASHESALDNIDSRINEEVYLESDFESIRTTIEEMQTFVCENYENSDNFTTDAKFIELSIELYQNAKYSIEYLEDNEENESITTNFSIVMFFNSIFDNIDTIRKMCKN